MKGKQKSLIQFMIIRTCEIFQVSEKSLLGVLKREKSGDCLGDCVSNLRGNLVFWTHIQVTYFFSDPGKRQLLPVFFHPQTTVDPKKRPHFQTLALKVLLPTTSKPVKWEEEEWRINDEIKREKQLNQMLIGRLLF